MRVNASTKRWYLDSILAPLVGPDQAKKFAQRHNIGRVGRAIGFFASLLNVGCAALENMVIFLYRNQQHAQCSGTLRLSNPGRFGLPPTRVEAMYAPESFGETPNAPLEVQP